MKKIGFFLEHLLLKNYETTKKTTTASATLRCSEATSPFSKDHSY